MDACTNTHSHTNQYAEPEPLRRLITASFTATAAAGFHTSFFSLKCPDGFNLLKKKKKMLSWFSESNPALNLMGNTLYFNENTNINLHYSFGAQLINHYCISTLLSHWEQGQEAVPGAVLCVAMKTDILPVCYTLAAHLSPSKCTADFTWQDLSGDDDLYHLFNTSLQTASQNPKYTCFFPRKPQWEPTHNPVWIPLVLNYKGWRETALLSLAAAILRLCVLGFS